MKRLFKRLFGRSNEDESQRGGRNCRCVHFMPDKSDGDSCNRANPERVEQALKAQGYEIIWKGDYSDVCGIWEGFEPQFHVKHHERVYKIQYKGHELFKVIYDFDPVAYGDYNAMSQAVIKTMSEYENIPIHFAYKDGAWRVWAGGCHLLYSEIELFIKLYILDSDLVIKRCQEEYDKIKQQH